MALPNLPYGTQQTPRLSELDTTFNAVGALGIVPCTASGVNTLALTPAASTPTISTYTNYLRFAFVAPSTTTGAVTVAVAGLAPLKLFLLGGITQVGAADLQGGGFYDIAYVSSLDSNAGGFQLVVGSSNPPPAQTAFPVLIVQDRKAVGTAGKVYGADAAYSDRDVTTVILNTLVSGGGVSNPNIVLPQGTFDVEATLCYNVMAGQWVKAQLFNTTSSSVQQDTNANDIVSLNGGSPASVALNSSMALGARFTLGAQAQLRFRSASTTAASTFAGVADNFGVSEVYLQAKFTKIL